MKKTVLLTILITSIGVSPVFALASAPIDAPESLEEARSLGERFLEGLPDVVKTALREMFDWLKNLWNSYVFPFLGYLREKVSIFLEEEVEKKRPEVEKEFEKEKEELRDEFPKVSKSLWERFRELIE